MTSTGFTTTSPGGDHTVGHQAASPINATSRPNPASPLSRLCLAIELALVGAVTVSSGTARLTDHRVPAMTPRQLIDGATRTGFGGTSETPRFTGVAHREDIAA